MHDTLNRRSHEVRGQEDGHYEQSPKEFKDRLTIFDNYIPVNAEMSKQPEYTLTFSPREQELAEGVRGTIEGFIDQATDERRPAVTFDEMFSRFDSELRSRQDTMDEQTKDEMFLVATKMKYNLEVRYNASKKRDGSEGLSVPAGTFPSYEEWLKSRFESRARL